MVDFYSSILLEAGRAAARSRVVRKSPLRLAGDSIQRQTYRSATERDLLVSDLREKKGTRSERRIVCSGKKTGEVQKVEPYMTV